MAVNEQIQEESAEGWIPELTVDLTTFAGRLRYLRTVLDASVSEIARRCELDDGSWRNWEAGVRPRDREEIAVRIAKATGASFTWLMLGGKKGAFPILAAPHNGTGPARASRQRGPTPTHPGEVGRNGY